MTTTNDAGRGSGSGPGSGVLERFDLGYVLAFPFRDPQAVSKFLIGSLAVLLIPFFLVGLVALAGFGVRTARRALAGEENPMADWDDLGGLLVDGLKALVASLAYILVIAAFAALGFGVIALWVAVGESVDSGVFIAMGVLATAVTVFFIVLLALLMKILLPVVWLQVVATGRIGSAFRFADNLSLVRENLGVYAVLLVTLFLFGILADMSFLLCGIGLIPGTFWWFAAAGGAVGHAGRIMGATPEPLPGGSSGAADWSPKIARSSSGSGAPPPPPAPDPPSDETSDPPPAPDAPKSNA